MNAVTDYKADGQEINGNDIELDQLLDCEDSDISERPMLVLSVVQVEELKDYIHDLIMSNGCLTTISQLLVESGGTCNGKIDFCSIGCLVEHHAESMSGILGLLQEFICANKEKLEQNIEEVLS